MIKNENLDTYIANMKEKIAIIRRNGGHSFWDTLIQFENKEYAKRKIVENFSKDSWNGYNFEFKVCGRGYVDIIIGW